VLTNIYRTDLIPPIVSMCAIVCWRPT